MVVVGHRVGAVLGVPGLGGVYPRRLPHVASCGRLSLARMLWLLPAALRRRRAARDRRRYVLTYLGSQVPLFSRAQFSRALPKAVLPNEAFCPEAFPAERKMVKMTLAELRQQKEAIGQKREKKKRLKKKLDEEMVKLDQVEAQVDERIAWLEAAPWHGPKGEAEDDMPEWMEELVKEDQVEEEEGLRRWWKLAVRSGIGRIGGSGRKSGEDVTEEDEDEHKEDVTEADKDEDKEEDVDEEHKEDITEEHKEDITEEDVVGEDITEEDKDEHKEQAEDVEDAMPKAVQYAMKWYFQNGDARGIPQKFTPCLYFFKARHGCQKKERCPFSHDKNIFMKKPLKGCLENLVWEWKERKLFPHPPNHPPPGWVERKKHRPE